jgi:hypothetical protein
MPRSIRGLQSMPLAAEGLVYYSGAYNQVYALDGSTGEVIWYYSHKLNEDLISKQTHSPYNRGIALGASNLYMGMLDGKLVVIDAKTGKLNWETKLIDSERLTVGFTGAPLFVKEKSSSVRRGRVALSRPDLWVDAETGREYGVLHGWRQRGHQVRCAQHLGKRFMEDRWWRRLDGRRLRCRNQYRVVGNRQPGPALRLVRR